MVMQSKEPEYDKPILVVNTDGMYDDLIRQLAVTSDSIFARGKRIDRSIIVGNPTELTNQLDCLISQFAK